MKRRSWKPGRRRLALVGLLIAGGAGWLGWQVAKQADQGGRVAALSLPASGAASTGAVFAAVGGPATGGSPGIAGSPAPAPRSSDPRSAEDAVEFCGLGRVTEVDVESRNPLVRARVQGWLTALDQRKDAVLSRLSTRLAVGAPGEQVAARLLMSDPEGAALVAGRSRDAAAYRLALLGCGLSETTLNCRALTVQGWAQLDPDDARPWMRLMSGAMARRDEAAALEALEQVLQRHKLSPTRALLGAVMPAYAGSDDPEGLGLATVDIIGREAAILGADSLGFSRYCTAEGVKDASRRERCERMARWQFKHADSVLDAEIALGIADRVGLPAEQRPFTREQLRRGREKLFDETLRTSGYDCASLARVAGWPAQFGQHSELQMALQAAAER